MAISPNVTFVSGAVYTATQANQYGFGIVALTKVTLTDSTITADEVQVVSTSFTAIANRHYKITYYEPEVSSSATSYMQISIRKTALVGGTLLNQGTVINGNGTTTFASSNAVAVVTLTAGAQQVCGTLQCSSGTGKASRSATNFGFIMVEDIGPA